MSTPAIELPSRGTLFWADRARALFNGAGYALAVCLVLTAWWILTGVLPDALAGHWRAVAHMAALTLGYSIFAWLPWPILTPLVVNLAPRAGVQRSRSN